jgi:hypothetical protein
VSRKHLLHDSFQGVYIGGDDLPKDSIELYEAPKLSVVAPEFYGKRLNDINYLFERKLAA